MYRGLEDKVVLVTGAAGGIGRPTARLFAESGARVVCVDLQPEPLEVLVADLPGSGHTWVAKNLSNQRTSEDLASQILATQGRIDVLAHLAAVLMTIDLTDVTEEQWDAHMDANVKATFFLARACGEAMVRAGDGGRLIIMSSGAWLSGGLATRLPYATTKGAVNTMVRSLAKAYGHADITVNSVAPGLIDTVMMRSGLTETKRAELELATPLRRFGDPEEVAEVVAFLGSAAASFISGATINVSGGNTMY